MSMLVSGFSRKFSSSSASLVARAKKETLRRVVFQQTQASFSTYYDSQSGLHLPVHKEDEISLIIDKSDTKDASFVPQQLYKEDAGSSDMPDKLKDLTKQGIHGVRLPLAAFPRDVRNLKILSAIAPSPNFTFFVPMTSSSQKIPPLQSVSLMMDYKTLTNLDDDTGNPEFSDETPTTLMFGHEECGNSEPVSISNQVATLIDEKGLGDYLWLSPSEHADSEDVIRFYEELIYLDVAGPMIKSRLIMETSDDDLIEEAMMSGINKFVISDETAIDKVQEIAEDLGKEILCHHE